MPEDNTAEGATSPEPTTAAEQVAETAAPVLSPENLLPPPETLKSFFIPTEIVVEISKLLMKVPEGSAEERVRAFNEILSLMQARFKLKLDAEPFLMNGLIAARPTVLLGEDIEAQRKKVAEQAKGKEATV